MTDPDLAAELDAAMGAAGDQELRIPMRDVGRAVIALAELRGAGLADPRPWHSRFMLDRVDTIARMLGVEDLLKQISGQVLEGWKPGESR